MKQSQQQSRRNFLSKIPFLGALSLMPSLALSNVTSEETGNKKRRRKDQAGKVKLSIFQTTDVHCQIHPHDEMFWEDGQKVFRKTGGYAEMATYFKKLRDENPMSFFIDTGDMFQGSELSVKTTGQAIAPILNAMDYDLYLPGNWEVIYYKENMQKLLGGLNAPKICANMFHDLGDGKKGELIFPAYHIWFKDGIKVGFIGYTDPLVPLRQSPNYSKGILYTAPEENLAHYVRVLKEQEQCQVVIVIAHLGLSQQIHLSNLDQCNGVDYILGGDTHERVRVPIQGKYAKVVEPGAFGSFIGQLDLYFQDGKFVNDEYALLEVKSNELRPDPEVSAIISNNESQYIEDITSVVGYSAVPLYRYFVIENTIDTLILDALSWQMSDVDIVLSNGFRFCPPRVTPDETGNIPITNGFIYDMLPVDSTVRTAEVTGEQISKWLEKELNNVFAKEASERFGGWVVKFRGMKVEFNAFGEKGKRVQRVWVNDQLLELNKLYKVCACERDGDPADMLCRIKGVKDAMNTNYTLHQVMRDYLKANPLVSPIPHKSAVALDAPETLLTQVSGVNYEFK
jgi:2',3'-cyclic-nucleotide 2'-phosphodiesterase (5'-nucleotidase family)